MAQSFIWIIAILVTVGIIWRPFKWPEAVWALAGAFLLLLNKSITLHQAIRGMAKGTDVYLFLTGMMLLAETAREEGLFTWLAAHATRLAKGSPGRLFLLIYVVGIIVTVFLSNDATAVVLTPAVAAAVRSARVQRPLPYLLICAFIANAASFVLPISNPANLVIYGSHMPPLLQWLPRYAFSSFVSILLTYLLLRWTQRNDLRQNMQQEISVPLLSRGGKLALAGIGLTTVVVLTASALDVRLGWPTALTGLLTTIAVLLSTKKNPMIIIRGASWGVLLLVAGLFVIVEALNTTGLTHDISALIQKSASQSVTKTAWYSGIGIALASNVVNNLPSGLVAGSALQLTKVPEIIRSAILIGVDLGPNLSVTGSLATILWLVALRREQLHVSAWTFLKLGVLVMTFALIFTLAALFI